MSRRARLVLADVPLHIIQRGNNRVQCFYTDVDYLVYLDLLRECAEDTYCSMHAFVLMTNHVHLLLSPGSETAPGMLMKALGQRYVQYINRRYGRSGTLWEGRYRSCLVDHARYLLVCQRYIELNPVRAQMVAHPSQYRWSSHRANGYGEASPLVTPHVIYAELGVDRAARELAYRSLFNDELSAQFVEQVRHATNGNFALGDDAFVEKMESKLGRDARPQKAGRRRIAY